MQRTPPRSQPHRAPVADHPHETPRTLVRLAADGTILDGDIAAAAFFGPLEGMSVASVVVSPDPLPPPPWSGAVTLRRADGTTCAGEGMVTSLPGEEGHLLVTGPAQYPRDILFSLRNTALPVALRDAASVFRLVNPAFAALFDKPEQAFHDATPEAVLPRNIAATFRENDMTVLSQRQALCHRVQCGPSPHGEQRRVIAIPLHRTAWGAAILDIVLPQHSGTDTGCQAREGAPPAGDAWKMLLDDMPVLLGLTGLDGRVHLLNRAGHELLRLPHGTARGRSRDELLPEPIASLLAQDSERMREEGTPSQMEITLPHNARGGDERTLLVQRFPVRGPQRGLRAVGSVAMEITGIKRTEMLLRERLSHIEDMVVTRTEELRMANEALTRSSSRFRRLFDYAPDGLLLQREDGTILDCNHAGEAMLALTRAEILGQKVQDICLDGVELPVPDADAVTIRTRADMLRGRVPFPAEVSIRSLDIDGEHTLLLSLRDISARVYTERRLNLFELVFRNALEGIVITDGSGSILAANPAFTTITGWEERDVVGSNPRILKSNRHDRAFYERMWRGLHEKGAWEGEIWNKRANGEHYPEWLSISAVREDGTAATNYVALFHDISDLKAKEAQIRYQGMHDALTGLPNRTLLRERLREVLASTKGSDRLYGLLYIDIDNFKTINDSLGHAAGDKYIAEVAEHLALLIRPEDVLARLGGDEYGILVTNPAEEREVVLIAERILHHFSLPIILLGRELHVGLSIGIAIHPADGDDPDELLTNADLAMYRAKAQGKNTYERFTPQLHDRVRSRMELEGRLRHALRHGQIVPYFQPRVDLATGRIVGVEALARWTLPDGTRVSPGEFIPVAEDLGLIFDLGEHMLRSSLAFSRQMLDAGLPPVTMAVNLSLVQCRHVDLVARVLAALRDTGVAPSLLELEITESAIMSDVTRTLRKLDRLAGMGITLAVDDFGTGYSSLYHLKHMPLHTLKIDQSFVRDLPHQTGSRSIALTMLAMARSLDLHVIAEGVENAAQMHFLRDHGCRVVQGFLFSPAIPGAQLADMLARGAVYDVKYAPGELSFNTMK